MNTEPLPATETINKRSANLDTLSTLDMLQLINAEDQLVAAAVHTQIAAIARAVLDGSRDPVRLYRVLWRGGDQIGKRL